MLLLLLLTTVTTLCMEVLISETVIGRSFEKKINCMLLSLWHGIKFTAIAKVTLSMVCLCRREII